MLAPRAVPSVSCRPSVPACLSVNSNLLTETLELLVASIASGVVGIWYVCSRYGVLNAPVRGAWKHYSCSKSVLFSYFKIPFIGYKRTTELEAQLATFSAVPSIYRRIVLCSFKQETSNSLDGTANTTCSYGTAAFSPQAILHGFST